MADAPMTENKFFHIVAMAFGATFLGLLGYFAYTVQDTKVLLTGMSHDVASIKENTDKSFGWTAKRLDSHENTLKALDDRLRTLEARRK